MGATDSTGMGFRKFAHVKVVNQQHPRFGLTGTVVQVDGHRVWVAFPGGKVQAIRDSSLRVIVHR